MSIEIERKNEYWEASDGAWSFDGQTWYKKDKDSIHKDGAEYVLALRDHLDTTTEPQRAKVVEREIVIPSEGDYVQWAEHNGPNARSFGWLSKPLKVTSVDNEEKCFYHGNNLNTAWYFSNYGYTIVPDPTPEPEVFTGPPDKWGKGWYREAGGRIMVFVGVDKEWASVAEFGPVRGSLSGGYIYSSVCKFHRISDNPADGVKWEGGEG